MNRAQIGLNMISFRSHNQMSSLILFITIGHTGKWRQDDLLSIVHFLQVTSVLRPFYMKFYIQSDTSKERR